MNKPIQLNGCHNRPPFIKSYIAQNGVFKDKIEHGNQWLKLSGKNVKVVTSKDCQYTKSNEGKIDPKCDGCNHKEYEK